MLCVKEVYQEEQEGCIRMSQKMKINVNRELMGEIPGLQGDPRFGAEVVPDLMMCGMVDKIAITHHCKHCDCCSAANTDSSSDSGTEDLEDDMD